MDLIVYFIVCQWGVEVVEGVSWYSKREEMMQLYTTMFQGSKTRHVLINGGPTNRAWWQHVGHTKVEVYDKKEASQREFIGVRNHEEKRVNVKQDIDSYLLVTRVPSMVKLFENDFGTKREGKVGKLEEEIGSWYSLGRVGEMS